jgi:hypothetical protein
MRSWSRYILVLSLASAELIGLLIAFQYRKYWLPDGLKEAAKFLFRNEGLATALLASPIAYALWIFRNEDKKRDQKAHASGMVQDDMHKLQEWASLPEAPENQGAKTYVVVRVEQYLRQVTTDDPVYVQLWATIKTLWINYEYSKDVFIESKMGTRPDDSRPEIDEHEMAHRWDMALEELEMPPQPPYVAAIIGVVDDFLRKKGKDITCEETRGWEQIWQYNEKEFRAPKYVDTPHGPVLRSQISRGA